MGDLMFNRIYPVIDRPGGASIRHWVVVLEEVAKTYPADAIYVFGHGNAKFGVRANVIMPGLMETPMAIEGLSEALGIPKDKLIEQRHASVPLGGRMGTAWDVP